MASTIRAFLPVSGDPPALRRAFVADPGRWLPEARPVGPDRWAFTVHAGQLSQRVEARVGSAWRVGGSQWRSLSWDPASEQPATLERLLPSLDGELGLHVLDGLVTLVLDARYRPPGGALGATLDDLALHRVARGTAERLLAAIAARLTAESVLAVDLDALVVEEGEPEPR